MPSLGADPSAGRTLGLPMAAFVAYLGFQWWASWYPGQKPGGGGYVAQRMMSVKDERHSLLATLWFTVAHYCVRPWPWIIVALVSVVLYPKIADPEAGYIMVIGDHLPAGWQGLLVGGFFAAYMSTVSTQLNWGTSYLVSDVYARFIRPNAARLELITVSRLAVVGQFQFSAPVISSPAVRYSRMSRKRRGDFNQTAFQVVRESTGQTPKLEDPPPPPPPTGGGVKNPAAVALGRLGGLKGGNARAAKLSPAKRSRAAAKSRWHAKKSK